MRALTKDMINLLKEGKSIALVGLTGNGKTWFVLNELIPELNKADKKVEYFKDIENQVVPDKDTDIAILDEFETFVDREFLERAHPEEDPYYTEKYVEQVTDWLEKAEKITKQLILVITRDEEDIDNFVRSVNATDWGLPIVPIEYKDPRLSG
jgi:hypothetical protein